jgi:hypothetical protein
MASGSVRKKPLSSSGSYTANKLSPRHKVLKSQSRLLRMKRSPFNASGRKFAAEGLKGMRGAGHKRRALHVSRLSK